MHQQAVSSPSISVQEETLNNLHQYTYLGSILTDNLGSSLETQNRVKLASASFGRLSCRVFHNRHLTQSTKIAVYNAVCISTILYGCEAWTLYRCHIRELEAYNIRCLQSILGIRWWHRIFHVETERRVYHKSIPYLQGNFDGSDTSSDSQ